MQRTADQACLRRKEFADTKSAFQGRSHIITVGGYASLLGLRFRREAAPWLRALRRRKERSA